MSESEEFSAVHADGAMASRGQGLARRSLMRAMPAGLMPGLLSGLMLGLGGCSPIEVLNGLAPQRLAARGIAYGPDPRQRLDIYRPDGPGPFPVLMFVYGGSWQFGDRAQYRFVGSAFAGQGYLTVIADYRLYPQVRFPDFLHDSALAFAWTCDHAAGHGGDGRPPWLVGHSAGAYNVAMLALAGSYLDAVGRLSRSDLRGTVGIAGPYDFLPIEDPVIKTIFAAPASGFADPDTQPISFAGGAHAPMLLLAGTDDRTVRPGNTTRLAERIRAEGGRVEARLYPGVDHRTIIGAVSPLLRMLAPTMRDTLDFLRRTA